MAGGPVPPPYRSASIKPTFIRWNVNPFFFFENYCPGWPILTFSMFGQNWFFGSSIEKPEFLGLLALFVSLYPPPATLCNILIGKDKYIFNWIYSNEAWKRYVLSGQPRESTSVWTTLKQATCRHLMVPLPFGHLPPAIRKSCWWRKGYRPSVQGLTQHKDPMKAVWWKTPKNQTGFLSAIPV